MTAVTLKETGKTVAFGDHSADQIKAEELALLSHIAELLEQIEINTRKV